MIKNVNLYKKNIENVLKINDKFVELKNKTIMITGASGLIGISIIHILTYLNCVENYNIKIIALVRNANKLPEKLKKFKFISIVQQNILDKINCNMNVDFIIHAASNSHPVSFTNDPVGTMLGNIIGMNNILNFSLNHKTKRVLFVSSGEIYGQGEDNVNSFEENYNGKIDITNSRSCYPISKMATETLCISYSEQYGIETVIARPCHTYGPSYTENDSRVSAQFLKKAINCENLIMKSTGSQIRSYCYVLDCVTAILTILTKGKNKNAYNIANENSILSIKEMAEIIANKVNTKVLYEIATNNEKKGFNPVTRSVLSEKKLRNLGWKPYYNFPNGIEQTINIMK